MHPIAAWLRSPRMPTACCSAMVSTCRRRCRCSPIYSPPPDERSAPLRLSPERQKELLLGAIVTLLVRMAQARSLVFVLEDVHWADPTTLELVQALADEVRNLAAGVRGEHGLLAVFTTRTDLAPPWAASGVTVLPLGKLSRREIAAMVRGALPPGRSVPGDVVERIVERTDGVPLFVEEVVQALLQGDAAAAGDAIPGTLRELLSARLDGLSTSAHDTIQAAAALGREFQYDLLRAATRREDWVLRQDLLELVDGRLVYGRRAGADGGYVFKHALVRDAAYESMTRETRERTHRDIARALRDVLPVLGEQQPELLAYHLERGGDTTQAVAQWQKAGDRDFRRAAYAEAVQHLEHAREGLRSLPATLETTQREIELLITLGTTHLNTRGHADAETQATFARAQRLCETHGVDVSLKILAALAGAAIMRGDRAATEACCRASSASPARRVR
jgi:predicted ATPase